MADTDWTNEELSSLDRIPRYNILDPAAGGDAYSFGGDGYLDNQMRQANDVGIVGRAVRRMVLFAKGLADLTADDRRQTGEDRAAAAASASEVAESAVAVKADADRAAGAAAGVSLPVLAVGDELKFLQVKQDRSGFQTASVQKATQAQVQAGTDDSTFLTPLAAQILWSRPRITRTSNTAIAKANRSNLIDITSGTFTQTFVTCAMLGAGWEAIIRNLGTGDITLDPNGVETIDGLTSFIMYPGEARWIFCDGAALRSIVLEAGTKVFNSTDNFVWPPGINGAIVESVGPGAGGNRPGNGGATGGGGGGAGGRTVEAISAQQPGSATLATVGAGGLGGTASNTFGLPGGETSFGNLVVAQGGKVSGISVNSFGPGGNSSPDPGLYVTDSQMGTAVGSFGSNLTSTPADRGGAPGGTGSSTSGGQPGGKSNFAAGGGGGGGGSNTSGPPGKGGVGGNGTWSVAGGNGGSASVSGTNQVAGPGNNGEAGGPDRAGGGGGGGGGAYPTTTGQVGGRGGDGGYPGGGGGGGGGGTTSGNGGNGGAGRITVRMF